MDKQLESGNFAILCLTPENSKAPWIHHEAGALSKVVNESHVCPYLLDLEPIEIVGPLTKFQAARANKEDTFKLVKTINNALDAGVLPEELFRKVFDKWWPDLESSLSEILQTPQEPTESGKDLNKLKSVKRMIEELVDESRDFAKESKLQSENIRTMLKEIDNKQEKEIEEIGILRYLVNISDNLIKIQERIIGNGEEILDRLNK